MTLEKLSVVIDAQTAGLRREISNVQSQMASMSASVNQSLNTIPITTKKVTAKMRENYVKELDKMIAQTEYQLEVLDGKLMNVGNRFGWDSSESISVGGEIDTWDSYLRTLKKYKEGVTSGEIDIDDSAIKEFPYTMEQALSSIERLNGAMSVTIPIDEGQLSTVEGILEAIKVVIEEINNLQLLPDSPDTIIQIKELQKQLNSLLSMWAKANNIPANLKMTAFASMFPDLFKQIPQIKTPQRTEETSSPNSVGTIVKALLGVRSIYMLIRRIITQNENLTNAITNLFSSIATLLNPVLNFLARLINTISGLITKFAKLLGISTKNAKSNSNSERFLADFDELNKVSSNDTTTSNEGWKWLEKKLDEIANYFKNTQYVPGSQDDGGWASAEGGIIDYAPNLSEWLSKGVEWLYNLTKDGGTISTFFSNAWESIKTDFSNSWETLNETTFKPIKKAFANLKESAAGVWDTFTTAVKNAVNSCALAISNLWTTLKDGMKNTINNILTKIEKGINGIVKSINNAGLIKGLNKWFNANIALSTITIPKLANGGVIDQPTIAMVGEAGREIVTPENLLKDIVNSGNSELASAFIQVGRQIIASIENKDMNVTIGDDTIAMSAARGNANFKMRTGMGII